jgi:hypothetical protein
MKIPENPSNIQNETIMLNETNYPILGLEFVPGKLTDLQMTNFNWTYVNFTPSELLIQLSFENMNYISSRAAYPDSI